jgi:serine phosphatase RsbU (regulator of sigma subunit)
MMPSMDPTPSALLLLFDGPSQTEVIVNHTPFTIGRSPDRDIVLPHTYISRRHAEILYEQNQFHLVDCGSRSGSYVNGERVARRQLSIGDTIHIGALQGPTLRFGNSDATTSVLRELIHQAEPASELEKLRWFLEAARKLNGVGAVHEILISLAETALQLTRAERGYVFMKDAAKELRLAVGRTAEHGPLIDDSTVSHSAIQEAIRSGSEFIVTDTLAGESRSESIVAQNIRTVICIPLRKRTAGQALPDEEILGVLYLDSRQQLASLLRVDSDLLRTIATEAAVLVENASLARAEESARRYREELSIAAEIQQELMMVRIPELSYARVQAHSVPCKEIGGDFYDVLDTPDGLYVVVADISGKGVSAALLASTLQGLVHAQILAGQPLGHIAMFANRYICKKSVKKYATLVLLKLAPDGSVEYINCGHVQPILHSAEGIRILDNGNLPVGLMPDATFSHETARMRPGERIVVFTDGVTEAEDGSGEFYGDARLESSVLSGASVEVIFRNVQLFMAGAASTDDCTLLEICYGPCS